MICFSTDVVSAFNYAKCFLYIFLTYMTAKSVKRFERSNGLDTAQYKNYLYLYLFLPLEPEFTALSSICMLGFHFQHSL